MKERRITNYRVMHNVMSVLGYKPGEGGMCLGLSFMAMHAMLLDDVAAHNNRFTDIKAFSLKDHTHPETQGNITSQPGQPRYVPVHIRAYFDGLTLYQSNVRTGEILDPIKKINRQIPDSVLSFLIPSELAQVGNIEKITSFSGCYNLGELRTYIKNVKSACDEHHTTSITAFILRSGVHAIAIAYRPKDKKWLYFDSMNIEIKTGLAADVVMHIMHEFCHPADKTLEPHNISLIFDTNVYVIKNYVALNNRHDHIDLWKEKNHEITRVTPEKANKRSPSNGTWLILAAIHNHLTEVDDLLIAGADINMTHKNNTTALYCAVDTEHDEMVKKLLRAKADPNIGTTERLITPLLAAVINGNRNAAIQLLNAKANVNHRSQHGITALHFAAESGDTSILKILLDHGADIEAKQIHLGMTPLHVAIFKNNYAAVKLLLEHGANSDAKTDLNMTAIELAMLMENDKCTQLLIEHKRKPSIIKQGLFFEKLLPVKRIKPSDKKNGAEEYRAMVIAGK